MEYADVVKGFLDSGTGPIRGSYGGTGTAEDQLSGPVTTVPVTYALGPDDGPQKQFLSLAMGTCMDVAWSGGRSVVDQAGTDIWITEIGAAGERAQVQVSVDGYTFRTLGIAVSGAVNEFDLASVELTSVLVVRLIALDNLGASPGFDVVNIQGNVETFEPPTPKDPVAATDYFIGEEDTSITGNLLADNGAGADLDRQGLPLTATAGTFVTKEGGTVTIEADGDFVYLPKAGYSGADSFRYDITDQQGKTDRSTVFVTVTACPDSEVTLTSLSQSWNGTGCSDRIFGGGGLDTIFGWADDDLLTGGSLSDTFFGGEGDDTLSGGGGSDADVLNGDAGDDLFEGLGQAFLSDVISGGSGTDRVINVGTGDLTLGDAVAGWEGIEFLDAGGGNITLFNRQGIDLSALLLRNVEAILGNSFGQEVVGSNGANVIRGQGGADTLTGLGGADQITGGSGNDAIDGGGANDTITGGGGADELTGGLGNDRFEGKVSELSTVVIHGGGGDDLVINTGTGDLTLGNAVALWTGIETLDLAGTSVVLLNNTGLDLSALNLLNVVSIKGNSFGQAIVGSAGRDVIFGNGGTDSLSGGAGHDRLTGGNSKDVIDAGAGNDTVAGLGGADELTGGTGSDRFEGKGVELSAVMIHGGAGDDLVINTGTGDLTLGNAVALWTGIETLDLAGTSIVLLNNQGLDLSALNLLNVVSIKGNSFGQAIVGSAGRDVILGNGGTDSLSGGAGHDRLTGGNSKDVIDAGAGNDTVAGLGGADELTGGTGSDRFEGKGVELSTAIVYGGSGADVIVNTGAGDLTLGASTALWDGIEQLDLAGRAIISLNDQSIDLSGLSVVNCTGITGNSVAQGLTGSNSADTIGGGGGSDTLTGGAGADLMTGGSGGDRFVFAIGSGADLVTDFAAGPAAGDVLDFTAFATTLSGLDIVSATGGADTRVTVIATGETVLLAGVAFGTLVTASDILL